MDAFSRGYLNDLKDRRVMLEIDDQAYYGIVQKINVDAKMLSLEDVLDIYNNYKLENPYLINFRQIKSCLLIKTKEQLDLVTTRIHYRKKTRCTEFSILKEPNRFDEIRVSLKDMKTIEQALQKAVVITDTQPLLKAINKLKDYDNFSVLLHPFNLARHLEIPLMCFGNHKEFFVVDMLAFRTFHKALKDLLQNKAFRKILFQSCYLTDILNKSYDIKMEGISDLFTIWCLKEKSTKPFETLIDVASKELLIPKSFFEIDENFDAFKRPIDEKHVRMLGKLTMIQPYLHDHLVYGNLVKASRSQLEEIVNKTENLEISEIVSE